MGTQRRGKDEDDGAFGNARDRAHIASHSAPGSCPSASHPIIAGVGFCAARRRIIGARSPGARITRSHICRMPDARARLAGLPKTASKQHYALRSVGAKRHCNANILCQSKYFRARRVASWAGLKCAVRVIKATFSALPAQSPTTACSQHRQCSNPRRNKMRDARYKDTICICVPFSLWAAEIPKQIVGTLNSTHTPTEIERERAPTDQSRVLVGICFVFAPPSKCPTANDGER